MSFAAACSSDSAGLPQPSLHRGGSSPSSSLAVDVEAMAALEAVDVLVRAHQRRGHRAGRDHERLGLERAEQKRQHERDHDRLDRLADRVRRRAASSTRGWAGSFG